MQWFDEQHPLVTFDAEWHKDEIAFIVRVQADARDDLEKENARLRLQRDKLRANVERLEQELGELRLCRAHDVDPGKLPHAPRIVTGRSRGPASRA